MSLTSPYRRSSYAPVADCFSALRRLLRRWDRRGRLAAVPFRPNLEALEDRTTPSTFAVSRFDQVTLLAASASTPGPREVVFYETSVADYRALLQGAAAGTDQVILDASGDGVREMAAFLASHPGYDAVAVVAHGASGELSLGSADLNGATLDGYAAEWAVVRSALEAGADLSLYACDVAAGPAGAAFVNRLADATGATAAASTHLVGSAALGGSWNLDYQTGAMDTAVPFATDGFQGVLAATINTVAGEGPGFAGFSGDGGPADFAELNSPQGVAVDHDGNFYIADGANHVVRMVNAGGTITTFAGDHASGYSGDGGPATAAELTDPTGVALDSAGNLYIADPGANVIREVSAATGLISTFAGTGVAGYFGDGSSAAAAELYAPQAVAVDAAGNVYIADTGNNVIREVSATTGLISTFAGTGAAGYSGDGGSALAARIDAPTGVAVDGKGNVYFSDPADNVVRKVDAQGVISTVAGNKTAGAGYSGDGGQAVAAQLNSPQGVAVDSSGNLFIADDGNNVIREVNVTNNTISTVAGHGTAGYSGDGKGAVGALLNGPQGVAVDEHGNFYIADSGNNAVREVTISPILTVTPATLPAAQVGVSYTQSLAASYATATAPFTFTVTSGALPAGLTLSTQGLLSGIPTAGGVFTFRIQAADSSASPLFGAQNYSLIVNAPVIQANPTALPPAQVGVAYSQTLTGSGGTRPYSFAVTTGALPAGLSLSPTGLLSGTPTAGGAFNFTVTTTDSSTGAGPYSAGQDFSLNIAAPTISFVTPAVLPLGQLGAGYSQALTAAGGTAPYTFQVTVGSLPVGLSLSPDGVISGVPAAGGTYRFTVAATDSSTGSGPYSGSQKFILTVTTQPLPAYIITTFAGDGTPGYTGDFGPAASAALDYPESVAVDAAGDVYIADSANNVVRKVSTSGVITTFAGNGTPGYKGDSGLAVSAELNFPVGVAVDAAGDVYIADAGNNVIRKVDTSGVITTLAGNGTRGYIGDGKPAAYGELNDPLGVAVDGAGNVYIADYGNNVVRKVSATTGNLSTFAGNGTAGYTGDGGQAAAAELDALVAVTVDSSGDVYIADAADGVVRKVSATTGKISTVAGNGITGYSGDTGPAVAAELDDPESVAVDAAGNLYIADAGNNVVREVDTSGVITTFAGNGTAGYLGDGAPAAGAELNAPEGVATAALGSVYIADTGNDVVRKVAPVPATVSGQVTLSGAGVNNFMVEAFQPGAAHPTATAMTNSSGDYTINNLPIGTYEVRVVLPSGWAQLSSNPANLALGAGQNATGVNFNVWQFATVSGRVLSLLGTTGNDVVTFTAGTTDQVTFDGAAYSIAASAVDSINYTANGGADTVTLTGTGSGETATLQPNSSVLTGPGYTVMVNGATTVVVYGGGNDTVSLHDAAGGAGTFTATPAYAYLNGAGFFDEAVGFKTVVAYAAVGGSGGASLFDSPGNDTFVGTPADGYLYGAGFFNEAVGFKSVVAYAVAGGNDAAELFDSVGSNTFVGTPTNSYFLGAGYLNEAAGFKSVVAYAAKGGSDSAYLYDAPGNINTYVAFPTSAYLTGPGYINLVEGFTSVVAYAAPLSSDAAYLYDTPGNNTFVGTPTYSYFKGSGFIEAASGFRIVTATAAAGGSDTASVYDSPGNDVFVGRGKAGQLSGPNYSIAVHSFPEVIAYSLSGGDDTLDVQAQDYMFEHFGNWM